MRLFNKLAMTVMALIAAILPAQAQTSDLGEPIITFKTNAYKNSGATNIISVLIGTTENDYYDVDFGFGTSEVELIPASLKIDATTGESTWEGTLLQERVSAEGLVKIYGDASKIDYINLSGCAIEWIDMNACTNLTILYLEHNEFARLDLTPFSKLQTIYLGDNPFTESPLIIGGNKPNLYILELNQVDAIDPSFNLSDYPELITADFYHCLGIDKIDPTGCPELQSLSLEMTGVSSIDLSKNPELYHLNVSETRITQLDLTHNTKLQRLMVGHYSGTVNTDCKLSSIDLSKNTLLAILDIAGNNLTALDLSNNTNLTHLYANNNKLTALDISNNTNLISLNIRNNYFTFATLPANRNTFAEYYYDQHPYAVNRSYPAGQAIDFSELALRPETETTAAVYTDPRNAEASLLDASFYTYDNATAQLTFTAIPTDSVYVEFTNSAFADYRLRSSVFKVKKPSEYGQPSAIVSMTPASATGIQFSVGINGASAETPKTFYVDFGDGNRKEFTATSPDAETSVSGTSGNGPVVIYIPENDILTALAISDVQLSSIDLAEAAELRTLSIVNCGLSTIDMANNRCLTKIDLSGNQLTTLDLKGALGDYEKNVLRELVATDNQISKLNILNVGSLRTLNLANNKFTSFILKDYDYLENLDLSGNQLTTVNLSYLGNARTINLSGNQLTEIESIVDMPSLEKFDLSANNMTIATLPIINNSNYIYAPQNDLQIAAKAPGVNLTAQNRVINGVGTTFTWKKTDGTALTEGTDYTCDKGATVFLDENLGTVYCEMTNPAFPAFTGNNVFRTTATEVMGAPTHLIATFTTTENSNTGEVNFATKNVSSIYIDWRGDGSEYLEYPTKETYSLYTNQTTYAGANVKVYTYDDVADVTIFSINRIKMSQIDASPMTDLTTFSVGYADLDAEHCVFPSSPKMTELRINDNNFTSFDFTQFPNLVMFDMTGNQFETLDLTGAANLLFLYADRNNISEVKFSGNNNLYHIGLSNNNLETIDFTGLPALAQVMLNDNNFSTIDLSPIRNQIFGLNLQANNFDFSTLPVQSDYPNLQVYYYANQNPVAAECVDGKVDLSSQAKVGDTETVFQWYLGEVVLDTETGTFIGEALVEGEEYTVENGVTSFLYDFNDKVMCIMTNGVFSSCYLTTPLISVYSTGIDTVDNDADADQNVDVYNLQGVKLRSQVSAATATDNLPAGLYIVGNRKVLVR